jgi:diguanylate cyclase (GGDEF)-like protein
MPDGEGHAVIIAEDEPSVRALLGRQLEDAGYSVVSCADGEEALEAVRRQGSGIILADWMMPKMDGIQLCRAVRELCASEELGVVYYILVTAKSKQEQMVAGLDAGADDYLTKPYHAKELLARLRAGERIFELQRQLMRRQEELRAANRELECMAHTDPLTGLANRRRLFERLEEAWSLARRHKRPLTCVMFDLDDFKQVNDAHGHNAGDDVLREIGGLLAKQSRRHDIIGRFGGEEFLLICPETSIDGATVAAERIRQRVAGQPIAVAGSTVQVTLSAGVAAARPEHKSSDAWIAEADAMLYRAKDGGRNQVWVMGADGATHVLAEASAAF